MTPCMLDYDRQTLRWFSEEVIEPDRNADNYMKFELFLTSYARDFYKPRATSRSIPSILRNLDLEPHSVASVLSQYEVEPVIDIEASRATVTLLHGDLCPGNMLVSTGDDFYLIDFELMHVGMLALEFARATTRSNIEMIQWVIGHCSGDDVLSPRQQLLVAAAIRLARVNKQKTDITSSVAETSSDGVQEISSVTRSEKKVVRLMELLLDFPAEGDTACQNERMADNGRDVEHIGPEL